MTVQSSSVCLHPSRRASHLCALDIIRERDGQIESKKQSKNEQTRTIPEKVLVHHDPQGVSHGLLLLRQMGVELLAELGRQFLDDHLRVANVLAVEGDPGRLPLRSKGLLVVDLRGRGGRVRYAGLRLIMRKIKARMW